MRMRDRLLTGALAGALLLNSSATAAPRTDPYAPFKRFTTQSLTAPVPIQATLEHLVRSPRPIDAVSHGIFIDSNGPMVVQEKVPQLLPRLAFEYYLITQVKSNEVVFTEGSETPIAKFTLEPGTQAYVKWQMQRDEGVRRAYIKTVADNLLPKIIKDLKGRTVTIEYSDGTKRTKPVDTSDIGYRIGSADTIAQAIDRVKPYAPYFTAQAANEGLDPLIWANTVQETNFDIDLVSYLGYEGPFQLGREEARRQGLVVPEKVEVVKWVTVRKNGKAVMKNGKPVKRKVVTHKEVTPRGAHINESFHPILPSGGAFPTIREYAIMTGGQLSGLSGYHAGPKNIYDMRLLHVKNADARVVVESTVSDLVAQEYGFSRVKRLPVSDARTSLPLEQQAWMISVGWRLPSNKTSYKIESSKYVVRTLAIMQLISEADLSSKPFAAEAVAIDYLGKQRIKGRDLEPFFSSNKEFLAYNNHFRNFMLYPEKGIQTGDLTVPEGTRIFLPLGSAGEFLDRFVGVIEPVMPVVYSDGSIAPLPPRGPIIPADIIYSLEVQLPRSRGKYHSVDTKRMAEIFEMLKAAAETHPTPFRRSQLNAAKLDLSYFNEGYYNPFVIADNDETPSGTGSRPAAASSR